MSTPRPTTFCECGCGEPVARRYKPGHDARHKSALVTGLDSLRACDRTRAADSLLDLGWGGFAPAATLRAVPWTGPRGRHLPHIADVATWQVDHLGGHHSHRQCPALTRAARKVGGTNPITRLASDRYVTLVGNTPEQTTRLSRSWDQCGQCATAMTRDEYAERGGVGKAKAWEGEPRTPKRIPLSWDVEMDDDTERLIHVTSNPITGRITRQWPTEWAAPTITENAA